MDVSKSHILRGRMVFYKAFEGYSGIEFPLAMARTARPVHSFGHALNPNMPVLCGTVHASAGELIACGQASPQLPVAGQVSWGS